MSLSSSKLFTPLQLGDITLAHRVVMAPLTRFRADDSHAHTELGVEYYAQRAEVPGTLLITEATPISPEARLATIVFRVFGVMNKLQHGKRLAVRLGFLQFPMEQGGPVPRELSEDEIKQYIEQYVQAAKNAIHKAGFDGVEIHSANGYLLDQFLQDNSNKRSDRYGGSIENRARFVLEVVKAVTAAVGEKKTGIRFSPWNTFQGMRMQDPIPTFSYVVNELSQHHGDLAYVHFVEPLVEEAPTEDVQTVKRPESNDFAREIWGPRPFLSAGGYDAKRGEEAASKHDNTAIVFGRYFISNPDLPERLRNGIALADYDRNTFYSPGPKGYVDYARAGQVQA
ncbi:oxidoreductase [Rhizoctonia solani]|uniref:Oxidoreductase n=1 Tax=Rhizoctonia solani TaxID=456999 RepID=A0A8H7IE29_9AGAM|nr:oxidoreductase [Rhizoctonia solani]